MARWMVAIDSLSSCEPQPNCQLPPPIAQAPRPMGVISMPVFPNVRVCMRSPTFFLSTLIPYCFLHGMLFFHVTDMGLYVLTYTIHGVRGTERDRMKGLTDR